MCEGYFLKSRIAVLDRQPEREQGEQHEQRFAHCGLCCLESSLVLRGWCKAGYLGSAGLECSTRVCLICGCIHDVFLQRISAPLLQRGRASCFNCTRDE